MCKLTFLFYLTFLSSLTEAQNIFTALHLNENREYKTAKPKKIIEMNTFYNPGGKQVDKNVKTFDAAGMILTEERFDQTGNLKARLTYSNDTAKKLTLTRTMERWTPSGYSKETACYTYNGNNHLVGITDKDANGNIIRQTNLLINEKGHPIELVVLDQNGNSFGKETASYLYDKNKVITSVVANNGKIISTDTFKLSFVNAHLFPDNGETYNAHGDIISSVRRNINGTNKITAHEYLYDNFGNCVENKIYTVNARGNGKQKREIDRIFRKQYTY